ncbi:MAG: NAD(P)/FAD-dependent oxidoreductase [Novosphingobium sp.]|nr:NAD(P)/FAD-dependent oxidoreductase [Novosphingobium sp.]
MTCKATPILPPDQLDIPAILERYQIERDRRLRPEGQDQYARADTLIDDFYEADPHMPLIEREPISEDLEIAILGAGWAGIQAAYHLKQAGVNGFRTIDLAGDFGGCWYWNRYPGLQCDNESYAYMRLLEETDYIPSKKFADGWEIREHFQRIANQFGLYENALFHTQITSLQWDEVINRWRIETNRGDDIHARFVVMCGGPSNTPKLPGVPGIDSFKGKVFHTSRWDYDYTGGDPKTHELPKLADKRVAILGTGASSIQAVPYLGEYARQVYVIQRTPSSVDVRNNQPSDPDWVKSLEPGWTTRRRDNYHHFAQFGFERGEVDQVCDIWTEINRNLAAQFDEEDWPELTFEEFFERREIMDVQVMDRLRRRVAEIVEDRETAEALMPWYSMICKRPTSNDEYYPTFNRPNVELIDVSQTRGLEQITEKGFMVRGQEYEVDCLILASGYEITSELSRRMGIKTIEGRNGLSLYDHWADGYRTLHGNTAHGFPNMFFSGLIQGGLNISLPTILGQQAEHIAYLIKQARDRGAVCIEATEEAQDAWVRDIRATAIDLTEAVKSCTPGYYNNEGEETVRWYLGETYGPGWFAFLDLMEEWRSGDHLPGLIVTQEPSASDEIQPA